MIISQYFPVGTYSKKGLARVKASTSLIILLSAYGANSAQSLSLPMPSIETFCFLPPSSKGLSNARMAYGFLSELVKEELPRYFKSIYPV